MENTIILALNITDLPPGANVIKLFSLWFTDFRAKLVLFSLDWKNFTNDKGSSLLRKSINYGQKKFYNIGSSM